MARCHSLTVLFFLTAYQLPAQPSLTIEGTVLDSDSASPIPGAKVMLGLTTSPRPLRTVFADAFGMFHLSVNEPGTYGVTASAPGYQEGRGGGPAIEVDAAALDPTRTTTVPTLTIQLRHSASIEGRIRDGETRQPMSLLAVRVLRVWWSLGKRQITEERLGYTDDHGLFRFDELPSGEYLLEITKRKWASEAADDSPTRYPILIWPDSSPETLNPIPLRNGGEFNAGTIDYSRISLPRVSIRVRSNCPDGGNFQLLVSQRLGGKLVQRGSRKGSCSTPLVIDSLSPGSYRFQAQTSARPTPTGAAEIQLKAGSDADLEIQPASSALTTGKVICDCKPSLAQSVRPRTVEIRPFNGEALTMSLRNDGSFLTAFAGPAHVTIPTLPDGTYLKSVRYNGIESTGVVMLYPGVASILEVTLSDRPATVNGVLTTKDGKPVRRGRVVIAPWPLVPDATYPDFQTAELDDAGAFHIPNLAPGTYRIAPIGSAEWARPDEPNILASTLASGQELTLSENQIVPVAMVQP